MEQKNVLKMEVNEIMKEELNKKTKQDEVWGFKVETSDIRLDWAPVKTQTFQYLSLPCCRCNKKAKEIKILCKQVQSLKLMYEQNFEEISLMSNNFSYIIELASKNIINGIKVKTDNILKKKQQIIFKKNQTIKRLEAESISMFKALDKLIELQNKITRLQQQNIYLREKLTKASINKIKTLDTEVTESHQQFQQNFAFLNLNITEESGKVFPCFQLKDKDRAIDGKGKQSRDDDDFGIEGCLQKKRNLQIVQIRQQLKIIKNKLLHEKC